ncbi:hypothetical protein [Hydrogenimonas sp.]|uniref:hypothetical protein n=1 Tax=Hydrogenimonas sp. TaxID=2231112 RepID=UPI00262D36CD|nr:hypothetical protein [Hydrogenimonas sp.]
MHNRFEELQRRCKQRRRKMFLKWSAAFAVVIVIAAGAVFYRQGGFLVEPAGVTPTAAKPATVAPEPAAAECEAAASAPSQKRATPEKPAVKSSGSAPVAEKEAQTVRKKTVPKRVEKSAEKKRISAAGVTEKSAPAGRAPKSVKKSVPPKPKPAKKRAETKKPMQRPKAESVPGESPAQKSGALTTKKPIKPVLEVKEVQDLDALIRQYEKYPRYVTALKIANLYYEKKDYENAALWARKANLIDRDDEDAWVLYAKSEYALGNRERAKRILRLYLDYRDSVKARTLLLSWSREDGKEERRR